MRKLEHVDSMLMEHHRDQAEVIRACYQNQQDHAMPATRIESQPRHLFFVIDVAKAKFP